MLGDKLKAKEASVAHRDDYARIFYHFVQKWGADKRDLCAAELHMLLQMNSEIAQAPLLYTLQSAAEVGFSHMPAAATTPAAGPNPTVGDDNGTS